MATKAEKLSPSSERRRLSKRPGLSAGAVEQIVSYLVLAAVAAALIWGWYNRGDDGLNPGRGFGYALGIIGGSLMLVLLAYPLRKRAKAQTRAPGSVGFWFRFHMLLGLLGPLAILYHSRFSWGALNSAVALATMVIVASSGLVGRFLYSRVHRGYSDRKLELRTLKRDMDELLAVLESRGLAKAEINEWMQPFEGRAVAAGANFWSSASSVVRLGVATRRAQRTVLAHIPAGANRQTMQLRDTVGEFFEMVRRAAEFAFYDRLLRLWHLLHLPLFFLLVAAAVLHIVAVHMY